MPTADPGPTSLRQPPRYMTPRPPLSNHRSSARVSSAASSLPPATLLRARRVVDAPDISNVQAVTKTIRQLRDVPANTTSAGQDILQLISDYLVDVGPKEGPVHWFCPEATQLTIDCATFLLRLHAYESTSIQTWRRLLTRCLRGCCDCVRGLAEVKVTSRHTYVGVWS